jgi:hypothetical protein
MHGTRGRGHCPSPASAVERSTQVKGISSKSTVTIAPPVRLRFVSWRGRSGRRLAVMFRPVGQVIAAERAAVLLADRPAHRPPPGDAYPSRRDWTARTGQRVRSGAARATRPCMSVCPPPGHRSGAACGPLGRASYARHLERTGHEVRQLRTLPPADVQPLSPALWDHTLPSASLHGGRTTRTRSPTAANGSQGRHVIGQRRIRKR